MKRGFAGLRQPPAASYDAVVIGAGIGGMVCAALLGRAGLRVLVVEQHYMVGGFCSTFRRGGYTFDAGTHFYPLLGNPDTMTGKMLAGLGVRTRWVKMDPVDVFHLPDGTRFVVPADFAQYRAALDAAFPEERAGLERFFAAVREAYLMGLLVYFRGHDERRLGAMRDWTLREALDRFLVDPRLKLLLCADCPHWGSAPGRTSFVFDSMLRLSYFLGNYYPVGGSQAFADELAATVERHGGDVLVSTRGVRIEIDGGAGARAVTGVELETLRGPLRGTHRVAAPLVVCNGDLRAALRDLLPLTPAVAEWRAQADALRPTFPCFLTFLGLAGYDEAAIAEAQGYEWASWDAEAVGHGALRCKLFSPTLFEPSLAPPGGQIVIAQKVLALDYAAVADWPAHKAEVERYLFGELERRLPGALAKARVTESASARTSWRFTLNDRGAMLGWEMAPDQLGARRPDTSGPFRGLHFVGHWTRPGGGVTPVLASAERVASSILAGRAAAPEPASESPIAPGSLAC